MTQFLPPNLLALFAPRDPIPFLPQLEKLPHEKHHNQPYCGIAPFIRHFEDPRDAPPPTRAETREERLERKRREKIERRQTVLETELKLWDPHNDPNAQGDAFKTLFVARVNYDTTESKLRREFEVYGPIKRIYIVYNKRTGKPRGYAFIEYEHERDMHSAYKHADGKKIDGRRVLVDVEERDRGDRHERSRDRDRERRRSRSRERRRRTRSRERERGAGEDGGSRRRERDREARGERSRERSRDRERKRRSRSRDRKRDRDRTKGPEGEEAAGDAPQEAAERGPDEQPEGEPGAEGEDQRRDKERDRDRRRSHRDRDRRRDRDREHKRDRDRDRERRDDRHAEPQDQAPEEDNGPSLKAADEYSQDESMEPPTEEPEDYGNGENGYKMEAAGEEY
ncbi:hypothetical protein WMY93_001778 [Mugilogobius chulae]|uniref:U1 small nuclear ribonucleoprotein 70 kDa n=1 Tax=Mugilogobius chulae TaxID=88201 RepID=A0AAW0Q1H5_9GOBI